MSKLQLVYRITIITAARLLLNTSKRFIYTFAPALSRFLGVPLTSITSLIAINQGTSILGIFLAPLGDRYGYKLLMLIGLTCLTSGMFAAGFFPLYVTLIFTVIVAGLGKTVFDPAIQAYVGVRVPYNRRGLVIGILELSWAGSTMIGIPLAGYLIEKAGWQITFIVIGALSLLFLLLVMVCVPWDEGVGKTQTEKQPVLGLWKNLLKLRTARGMLLFFFFIGIANDNIFVVYSSWLEDSFSLGLVALGIGTSVIGIAEIFGEGITAVFGDRIGLKRAIVIGLVASIVSFLLLPFFNSSLTMALIALFLIFISFEFTIVCSLSLSTELAPESRATMMSGVFASAGLGRVIGATIGGPAWLWGGLPAIGGISATFTLVGLFCLIWGLSGWE